MNNLKSPKIVKFMKGILILLIFIGCTNSSSYFDNLKSEYQLDKNSFILKYEDDLSIDDNGFCYKEGYFSPFKCFDAKNDSIYFEE